MIDEIRGRAGGRGEVRRGVIKRRACSRPVNNKLMADECVNRTDDQFITTVGGGGNKRRGRRGRREWEERRG